MGRPRRASVSQLSQAEVQFLEKKIPSVNSCEVYCMMWMVSWLNIKGPRSRQLFAHHSELFAGVWACLAICATVGFSMPLTPYSVISGIEWMHTALTCATNFFWAFGVLFLSNASLVSALYSVGINKVVDEKEYGDFIDQMSQYYMNLPMRLGCIGLWSVTNGLTTTFALRLNGLELWVILASIVLQTILGNAQKKMIVSLLTCKATTEALENNHATISASTIQKLLREYVDNEIKGEFGRARRADFLRKREFWHSETMTELAGRIYDAWKDNMIRGFLQEAGIMSGGLSAPLPTSHVAASEKKCKMAEMSAKVASDKGEEMSENLAGEDADVQAILGNTV